jgi:hypothetical protein
MLEIKNHMYQIFKTVDNGVTVVIPPKGKGVLHSETITDQLKTASERAFISYRKI